MLRLMLLGFVGFVLGLTGGWMSPAETIVSQSSAAEVVAARERTFRSEPISEPTSSLAVTPIDSSGTPEVVSEASGSGQAANKRKQHRAKLAMASRMPADLRAATEIDDDEDGDE
jgi:hypothetical protein